MSHVFKTILAVGVLVGGLAVSNASFAAKPILPTCTGLEIIAAKALAAKVKALSLTNPTAALKIAENVAINRSKCFQVAFGAALDGTGTASTGPIPASAS